MDASKQRIQLVKLSFSLSMKQYSQVCGVLRRSTRLTFAILLGRRASVLRTTIRVGRSSCRRSTTVIASYCEVFEHVTDILSSNLVLLLALQILEAAYKPASSLGIPPAIRNLPRDSVRHVMGRSMAPPYMQLPLLYWISKELIVQVLCNVRLFLCGAVS